MMWSYEAFLTEGDALVALSQERESGVWEWRHGPRPHLLGNSYLVSRGNERQRTTTATQRTNVHTQGRNDSQSISTAIDDINTLLLEDDHHDATMLSLEDQAVVSTTSSTSGETVLYEFHIVFHAVYHTPVLYFRLSQLDGSPLSFSTKDVYLPGGHTHTALIAMDDHPVLGSPFYLLHPCETASAMTLLLDQPETMSGAQTHKKQETRPQCTTESGRTPKYLLVWLSLVQPVTGINPLMY